MQAMGQVAVGIVLALSSVCVLGTDSGNSASSRREVLQQLLNSSHYDPRIPPNYDEGRATHVTVQIYILSIHSINEISMDYSMDILLRQTWNDQRLNFESLSNISSLELDQRMIDKVWIPDTYFPNEKKANIHTVTSPNKLLHILEDGSVMYSVRIALTLTCRMKLHKYPLDHQICPLLIESYGFSVDNVVFQWQENTTVIIQDQEMPHFHLNLPPRAETCNQNYKFYSDANFSCLVAKLYFKRNLGFYMAQVFFPCILIVCLSWISFWIHRDAVPARVSLGVTTILTITTQIAGIQSALPRISYVKAIDVWTSTCLMFVFASILEYAFVNVQTRRHLHSTDKNKDESAEVSKEVNSALLPKGDTNQYPKKKHVVDHLKRAHLADKISRVLFPVCFAVFNLGFWLHYLVIKKENDVQ